VLVSAPTERRRRRPFNRWVDGGGGGTVRSLGRRSSLLDDLEVWEARLDAAHSDLVGVSGIASVDTVLAPRGRYTLNQPQEKGDKTETAASSAVSGALRRLS
jgi:hypothetical protein